MRFPVEEICAIAKQKGILIFIDGAHAPGHIDLDLKNLDVDIYTGACHKWMMTAKGSSFLYVKKELQHLFDPLVVSWGYNSVMPSHSQFLDYHQMQGTRDISAFLTIPKAIQFMEENNWDAVRANCRKLVLQNAQRFCDILNTAPLCPIDDTFLVQMYSVKIRSSNPIQLQQILFEKYKIEIPIMTINEEYYIRFSINAFNTQDDLDKLYEALTEVL